MIKFIGIGEPFDMNFLDVSIFQLNLVDNNVVLQIRFLNSGSLLKYGKNRLHSRIRANKNIIN